MCATASCAAPIGLASLQTQLEVQIRAHIARYYDGWMVCDDEVCGNRTRMMRVYGKRCLREGCRGAMNPEAGLHTWVVKGINSTQYNDSQLYTQLLFYSSLFDSQKLLGSTKGSSRQGMTILPNHTVSAHLMFPEHITALVGKNIDTLTVLADTVERHLDECGRRWVDLKDLFGFMSIKSRGARQ